MERARAAFAQGDTDAADTYFREALAAGRDDAEVHHHLGFIARNRGDLDEAAARYADALERSPLDVHVHNNLGETRRAQGRLAEAASLFRRALALAPEEALVVANLGSVLLALKRPDLALPHLKRAVALNPEQLQAMYEIAICLCSMNRYDEAMPVYRRIYQTVPAANDARYLEALAYLAKGDFDTGWRKHEVRWYAHLGEPLRRLAPGPYWRGDDDITGQTLLVHAEQGHGDTVMMLRYIPLLQARGINVVLEVQPALKPLLEDTFQVFARGETSPPYEAQCSFMSLPRAFRTTMATIPASVPYLTVPPAALAKWRDRLGPQNGKRRIAVAWTGASTIWNRSIPLALLEPLFARPDCEIHIVQTTMEKDDRAVLAEMPPFIDHSQALDDFADTAAIVECMDMVITVDTVLAHMAGALARPVWTMLPFGAEYRWLSRGETSAWYPTMRLFRQPELYDWTSVVEAISDALDRL